MVRSCSERSLSYARTVKEGVTGKLLKTAIEYVKKQGGEIVEAYPVEPQKDKIPDVYAYAGLASTFRKVGFVEVFRRSETRPIMRYFIKKK
jgi:predicted CoA-binding protein